jgi:hypothetical protein
LKIKDEVFGPPVIDTRELVAGTFWYTVEEGKRAPVVEAKQGWLLLLPKGSPVISEWKGKIFGKYESNEAWHKQLHKLN